MRSSPRKRSGLLALATTALVALSGCMAMPNTGGDHSAPAASSPTTPDSSAGTEPTAVAPAPSEAPVAPTSSPNDVTYGVGDTIIVSANGGVRWQVEILGAIPDAASLTNRMAPPGSVFQAIEANFTLISGPTNSDVNDWLDFAVIDEAGGQHTTASAVTAVIQNDFWLLRFFKVGDEQFGRALVQTPESTTGTHWLLISRETGESWRLEL